MFNLYVAEKLQKQKEEKLKEEKLEIRIKNNRKSMKITKKYFKNNRATPKSVQSLPTKSRKFRNGHGNQPYCTKGHHINCN